MSIEFLGIDKDHWDFINWFANWISAFGTVGAVVVSLWLALRPERITLSVSAAIKVVVIPGTQMPPSRYINITVVNRGKRVAKVTAIGWACGSKRGKNRRTFFQRPGDQKDGMSSPLPVLLEDGQQAQWMFPKEKWLEQINTLYLKDWRKTIETFVVEVSTSIGQKFRESVDQALKDALKAAFIKLEQEHRINVEQGNKVWSKANMASIPRLKSRISLYLAICAAVAYLLAWSSGYSLALNPSMSMPRGLYVQQALAIASLQRGDVVAACIPNIEAAKVYRERNYMGASERCASGLPLVMKPIAGIPGDTVEVTAMGVSINGQLLPKSRVFDTDSDGQPIDHLPLGWKQNLAPGEFFLLANYIERSLDSRYYGPLQQTDIHGRVQPIYTIEKQ